MQSPETSSEYLNITFRHRDKTCIVIRDPNLRRAITQMANHRNCSQTEMAERLLYRVLQVLRRK